MLCHVRNAFTIFGTIGRADRSLVIPLIVATFCLIYGNLGLILEYTGVCEGDCG